MFEGFGDIRRLVDHLEDAVKVEPDDAPSIESERLALERDREAFEQEKRLERSMRALRDHTFT